MQESSNPSMEQVNAMSKVHPHHHLVVDKELHSQIVSFLTEQMIELTKQSEKENNNKKDDALVVPTKSMVEPMDDITQINKRKRIQIQDNMPYGETIITLQLPNNSIMNNIDWANVKLLTPSGDEASMADKNPKFSVTERLMNWMIKYEIQENEVADNTYYHHSQSNLEFGSVSEVIQFVLTESWADEPSDNKRVKVENAEGGENNEVEPVLSEGLVEDAESTEMDISIVNEHEINVSMSEPMAEPAPQPVVANQVAEPEPAVANQVVEPAASSQVPKLISNASYMFPYPDEEIYELMSTEDMLKEFELSGGFD